MNRSKLIVLLMAALALVALMVPAMAQEETGGIAITGTFGEGPDTFSQIYCTGTDCADVVGYMFMGLVGVDVESGTIQPNQEGALAESWEVSEDNLTYTITLKDIYTWSDGTPITSADLAAHWELLNNAEVEHPDAFILESIAGFEVIDDYTVEFTMNSPACSALNFIGGVTPIPAHVYGEVAAADLPTFEENLNPTVTSGLFTFGSYRPGELTTLLTNKDFVEGGAGDDEIRLDGFIQTVYSDQTVMLEALTEGEINFLEGIPANQQDSVRENSVENGGELQIAEFPGSTWDYMAFNLADPENPQPALDEDGNRIDQGYHPLFTDKMVRQAIGHAVDVDAIIEGAVFGNGSRMTAQLVPASWAYNEELAPRSYDQEIALEMLAEAGWVPNDAGRLICDNCLYAREVDESFNGSEFVFTLYTNAGNTRREAIGTVIQDELDKIGITVDFQTIEFNTLLEIMDAQSFDAFILGWRAGYPDDPNTVQLFGPGADIPGSGFNFTSFYNEEYAELEQQANSVPGCGQEDRAELYGRMQEIMYDEMPYLWMFSQNTMYAAQDDVLGFAPFNQAIDWNITSWAVVSQE